MSRTPIVRPAETQPAFAHDPRNTAWPYAQPVGAGANGRDIENMPGLAPEVKAPRDENFRIASALRQAAKNAGDDLPYVVYRPDGSGPATVADWPCIIRLEDLTTLLRAAGYGDPK